MRQSSVATAGPGHPTSNSDCRENEKHTVTGLKVDVNIDGTDGIAVGIGHLVFPVNTIIQQVGDGELSSGNDVITAVFGGNRIQFRAVSTPSQQIKINRKKKVKSIEQHCRKLT